MSATYLRRMAELAEIPPVALVAPTQQEWDALTPRQRQRVMDGFCRAESQEEQQDEATAEGDEHYEARDEVLQTLRRHFSGVGASLYVGAGRMVVYPASKGFTPDIIVVCGVSPHKRDCWMVSHEGRGVDVILEVLCNGDWRKDFVDNVKKYASLGVPEYFIYDVRRRALTGYRLAAGATELAEGATEYVALPRRAGRYRSERLGLELAVRRGKLRFFQSGALVPTPDEVITELEDIVEQEQARAQEEQARAEQALEALAEGILAVLQARGLSVSEADAAQVRACRDAGVLSRWMGRAAVIGAADLAAGKLFLDS